MNITGIFQITNWEESTDQNANTLNDDTKLTSATVKQSYLAADKLDTKKDTIIGESTVHYKMHYFANGNATFVGFEYINGSINNTALTLVLKHDGKFENGKASSKFLILDTNNETLKKNIGGSFVSGENGQASYTFTE